MREGFSLFVFVSTLTLKTCWASSRFPAIRMMIMTITMMRMMTMMTRREGAVSMRVREPLPASNMRNCAAQVAAARSK